MRSVRFPHQGLTLEVPDGTSPLGGLSPIAPGHGTPKQHLPTSMARRMMTMTDVTHNAATSAQSADITGSAHTPAVVKAMFQVSQN